MKYFASLIILFLIIQVSAQESNFGAVTVFNNLACGDSTLNLIPVSNVGDKNLSNCFIVREVFDQNLLTIFQDSSSKVSISPNTTFSFEMYLYGENIDQNGNYFIKFTIIADDDKNENNVSPSFNLRITRCCQVALVSLSEISCNGSDGSIEIEGVKGSPPYSYFWSNGSNESKISGLGPGEYSILMFDASSCIARDTFVLNEAESISANIVIQNESKPNGNDGTAESMPTGGSPPYTFMWSTGATTPDIVDLAPGDYSLTITDSAECTATFNFIVEGVICDIMANIVIQHESKLNGNDGTAESMPTGGSPPYAFLWSTGATTPDIVDLAPGDYSLTITDATECEGVFNFTVDPFKCDLLASINGPSILCPGEVETYDAVEMNGSPPYAYTWSTGSNTKSTSLTAGMYELTVTDSEGCTASASIDIDRFPPIVVDTTEIVNATGVLEDGAIYVDVFGGTPPYGYAWYKDSMIVSMDEDLVDFAAGDYNLVVVDNEGCIVATDTITIEMISSLVDLDFAFDIFPNPAIDHVNFLSKQSWQAEIYNIKGERVYTIPTSTAHTWLVNEQAPGVYYAKIWIGEELRSLKVIVTGK